MRRVLRAAEYEKPKIPTITFAALPFGLSFVILVFSDDEISYSVSSPILGERPSCRSIHSLKQVEEKVIL
jgi:hypothetical protein